jgi:hypothetical protein
MTPEERKLIDGLFDRMRSYGAPEKDRDAEAVISQAVRAMPDAPYMLVQSVLAQEYALQEAGKRIEELETQVRELNERAQRPAASSGGFLGGLLGGGRPTADRVTSVPPIGSRAVPSGVTERPSAWAAGGQPPQAQQQPPAAGGGFLRSAMTTAAGVAGGMLAAGAIQNMLGGGSGSATPAAATTAAAQPTPAAADSTHQASSEQQSQGEHSNVQDASHEDDGSSWGDDSWGDMDI